MKFYDFNPNNPEHLRERLAALEHDGELEFYAHDCMWMPRGVAAGRPLEPNRRYRPALEPEIVPYTLETFPVDLLRVKGKDGLWTIGRVGESGVHIMQLRTYTFQELLENFTRCDGSPCGVKKV